MDTVIGWIAVPLGYCMQWCYELLKNYGVAIIFFTLLTKIIQIPISVWVQKNSIKMVKMQPAINRIKAKFFGDADTIADEQSKLYKKEKYNPLASLIPLAIQIILLMGVVGVIYGPFDYLLHLPVELISKINDITVNLGYAQAGDSSIQIAAVQAIQNGDAASYMGVIPADILNQIQGLNFSFLGVDMGWNPSVIISTMPIIALAVPAVAGFSAWLLCVCQNKSNVLQSEQSALNKYGLMIISVGLSLYLGFFVPSGIALYWVSSNVFAILQLYILNAIIPPKKYVDYEALEESRQELSALESLSSKNEVSKEDKKREKADYKRFFSIANKHLVIYSERSGFYKYYEDIIDGLLKRTNMSIHYITNDPNDAIFEKAEKQPRIKPYYIGVKKMITLMMKIEADIVIMTTPDLDNYYLKRSLMRKDIEYIFVPHDPMSMHMGFREHSLDNFDTVFCTGPHIEKECRASEEYYKTKEKTMVEFGYPLLEKLVESNKSLKESEKHDKKQILIGPSWQEDNLLDSCVEKLIDELYCDDYHIIVRPHPEYMKRYSQKMNMLVEKYKDKVGDNLTFELDFSSNTSVYSSDLLITDWSGISVEFAFSTLNPVLFVNTKMKMENPNYDKIGIVPQEISLRDRIGVSLDKDKLDKVRETVIMLLGDSQYAKKIEEIRNSYFYNFGSQGKAGVDYLLKQLSKPKKK